MAYGTHAASNQSHPLFAANFCTFEKQHKQKNMPVRLRITLLFSLLVFIILSLFSTAIYLISRQSRIEAIQSRLLYRSKITAGLLSRQEVFDLDRIRQIDSISTLNLRQKVVQAYDYKNVPFYIYKEKVNENFDVPVNKLNDARINGMVYFQQDGREAVAYHYKGNNQRIVVVTAAKDAEGHMRLENLKQVLILSFLSGNLILLAAGYFFSARLLRPVRKITQDVAEISAHNLVRRLQTGAANDEWHQLASTLNELLNRLQESFDMQRRFISNASHELSTPLTSISSQLEVALQRDRQAEEYRRVIQSAYQDVRHMSKLTHTLLEFAKASGNPGGLEITKLRMDEVLLELPAQLAKLNAAFMATIEFADLPEDEERLVVFGNKQLLDTAIKNILVNACKYSPDNAATVRLEAGSSTIVIAIEDKGPGIPPDELPHIFQPFYRVEGNTSESTGGFGLGLSLAHRIIKLHKGSITVTSRMNEGSVFRIFLPVAGMDK